MTRKEKDIAADFTYTTKKDSHKLDLWNRDTYITQDKETSKQ